MSITLYKATELAKFENFIDPDTGEVDMDGFEQAGVALVEKQRAVVAYVKNQAAIVAMMKAAEKDLKAKRDALENRIEGLKKYLAMNMRASGTSEIAAIDGTFSAKLYLDRDESVVLEDGAEFPELCVVPPPPKAEPSKTLIKAAIENGEPVKGAHIVKRDRLTIK